MSPEIIPFLVCLVPFLPLFGYVIHTLFRNKISEKVAGIHGTAWVLASFVICLSIFITLQQQAKITVPLWQWLNVGNLSIPFNFVVDHLSIMMMFVITGIGSLIHIFSIGYMHGDAGFQRFFSYLNLFIFFMLILVMADNYVLMFVGWEGVGLCSYLLIGFWYKDHQNNEAANKAFIMNRIGDLALLMGLFLLFNTTNSLSFDQIFTGEALKSMNPVTLTWITVLLFIGATGKSAQIPLFTWLPDAMAGPTPVSALIHAATMVTAGIYLIVRSSMLFDLAPFTLEIILVIGLVTSIFAGTIALQQHDIKKVLAYSTVSQLGLMFFAIGLHAYDAAFFHVITHAFFKALLFLGAGSVIHGLHGAQDIRSMGGLKNKMKITHFTFLIGVMAIIALPPFAGFFSKDAILLAAFQKNPMYWVLGLVSGLITVFYMMRLYYLVFLGSERMDDDVKSKIHESPFVITFPLMVLAGLALLGGMLNIPHLFGGNQWLSHYLSDIASPHVHTIDPSTEWLLLMISLASILVVIYLAYRKFVVHKNVPADDQQLKGIPLLLNNKYYVDELYQQIIVHPFVKLSRFLKHIVEDQIIDGPINEVGNVSYYLSSKLKNIQTGNISYYLFVMALGMGSILFIFIIL